CYVWCGLSGLIELWHVVFFCGPNVIPPYDFETVYALDHINLVEQADFGYQLLCFKHYHRTTDDVENGVLNPDNWVPNEKLSDPVVRQAIAYGIDRQGLVDGLLYGRGQPINSPIDRKSVV